VEVSDRVMIGIDWDEGGKSGNEVVEGAVEVEVEVEVEVVKREDWSDVKFAFGDNINGFCIFSVFFVFLFIFIHFLL